VDALTSLAVSARAGDNAALDAFVRSAYADVWRLCASLVDKQSGEDLAQETFVRAIRTLPRFRGESSARTWLLAIARHACADELRSRSRRRRRDELHQRDLHGDAIAADTGQGIAISDLIARLEPARREAFVLTQMLGLSYSEAAQVCDCPSGTVRSRVARARSDLLGLLTNTSPDRNDSPGRSSSG
jgi:RNA polymerase sigma-70 factor, ECF subfamily